MFDVGMAELALIGVVALLVVGPERLPGLARTAGLWVGKGKRFLRQVKDDIDQEIKADELKRVLEEQKKSNPLHEIIEETSDNLKDIKQSTESAVQDAQQGLDPGSSDKDKS